MSPGFRVSYECSGARSLVLGDPARPIPTGQAVTVVPISSPPDFPPRRCETNRVLLVQGIWGAPDRIIPLGALNRLLAEHNVPNIVSTIRPAAPIPDQ